MQITIYEKLIAYYFCAFTAIALKAQGCIEALLRCS